MTGRVRTRYRGPTLRDTLSPFLLANLALLLASLFAGGASRLNPLPTAGIEIFALAIAPWAVFRIVQTPGIKRLTGPCIVIVCMALIPVVQLVPLPSVLWTQLPAGGQVRGIYDALGMPVQYRPLSLAPDLTLHSALAMLPGMVAFLSWTTLSADERRLGIVAVLGAVLLSLVLGVVQLSQGSAYVGYLYESTNHGNLVGFFANRNHEATLLLCALPFTAALLSNTDKAAVSRVFLIAICGGLTVIVIAALAAVSSRTGIILALPTLFFSAVVLIKSGRLGAPGRVTWIVASLVVAALGLILAFSLGPIMARFQTRLTDDVRFSFAPTIWRAAIHFFPFGSGLGTFDIVYRSFEPLGMVQEQFLNHAHDDYLEVFLEAGVLGLAVVAAGIGWIVTRIVRVWRWQRGRYSVLAQGASVAIAVMLVHSMFDYPLRTLAISALMGFSCAMLMRPVSEL